MMSFSPVIIVGVLLGALLGLWYFGGLWLTVLKAPGKDDPKKYLLLSFVFRLIPVMLGFWLAVRKSPAVFIAAVLTFFAVRFIMIRRVGRIQ